jgi:hypothetical protein
MSNIISLILVLASFGLFFGYIDPTYVHIKESKVQKEEYDRALNNSKELQAERDKLLEKFNQISKLDKTKLGKMLPDNIDNVRLLIDMDEMAKTFGMRIRGFKAGASDRSETIGRDGSQYGVLTVTFSTTATYNTFLAFLHDLERSLRILDVTAIQFASNDTSQLYDYGVTVRTYWLK